jgi:hypothetical protein
VTDRQFQEYVAAHRGIWEDGWRRIVFRVNAAMESAGIRLTVAEVESEPKRRINEAQSRLVDFIRALQAPPLVRLDPAVDPRRVFWMIGSNAVTSDDSMDQIIANDHARGFTKKEWERLIVVPMRKWEAQWDNWFVKIIEPLPILAKGGRAPDKDVEAAIQFREDYLRSVNRDAGNPEVVAAFNKKFPHKKIDVKKLTNGISYRKRKSDCEQQHDSVMLNSNLKCDASESEKAKNRKNARSRK